jgi:two-component system chemotaxis sensor kinase CheA
MDLGEADRAVVLAAIDRLLPEAAPEPVRPIAAPPAPAEFAGRADDPGGQVGTRVLRVDQEKVDRLMELVGELNVAKNGLTFLADAAEEEFGSRVLSRRIKDQYAGMHRIAEELQAAVMDVRMLPLSVAFGRFPRLVRDLSRRLGKTIELVTDGEDTMADKDVIEALGDPLVHLVRNSLDHGIELSEERVAAGKTPTARLTLAAVADGDAVIVEVSDDGRGVDPARVRRKAYEKGLITEEELESLSDADAVDLVFRPGFSTVEQVSDLSGRGVGMDAVRASVEKLGGSVTMRSRLGQGTSTRLRLPLSMAVTQVMVVSVAGQRFGIPVDLVVETVRVPAAEMGRVLHQEVVVMRGEVLPVVDLARALDMPWSPDPGSDRAVLVVNVNGQRVGLLVEQFHREVDVILKPMEGLLAYADEFSGTALLGDGLVLLVLNMKEVLGLAARVA